MARSESFVSGRPMILTMWHGQFDGGPNSDWNEFFRRVNVKGIVILSGLDFSYR